MSAQKPRLSDAVAAHHRDVETALTGVQMTASRYRQIKALTELVAVVGTFAGTAVGQLPWMVGAAVAVLAVGGVEAFDTFLAKRGQASDPVTRDELGDMVTREEVEELLDDSTSSDGDSR